MRVANKYQIAQENRQANKIHQQDFLPVLKKLGGYFGKQFIEISYDQRPNDVDDVDERTSFNIISSIIETSVMLPIEIQVTITTITASFTQ